MWEAIVQKVLNAVLCTTGSISLSTYYKWKVGVEISVEFLSEKDVLTLEEGGDTLPLPASLMRLSSNTINAEVETGIYLAMVAPLFAVIDAMKSTRITVTTPVQKEMIWPTARGRKITYQADLTLTMANSWGCVEYMVIEITNQGAASTWSVWTGDVSADDAVKPIKALAQTIFYSLAMGVPFALLTCGREFIGVTIAFDDDHVSSDTPPRAPLLTACSGTHEQLVPWLLRCSRIFEKRTFEEIRTFKRRCVMLMANADAMPVVYLPGGKKTAAEERGDAADFESDSNASEPADIVDMMDDGTAPTRALQRLPSKKRRLQVQASSDRKPPSTGVHSLAGSSDVEDLHSYIDHHPSHLRGGSSGRKRTYHSSVPPLKRCYDLSLAEVLDLDSLPVLRVDEVIREPLYFEGVMVPLRTLFYDATIKAEYLKSHAVYNSLVEHLKFLHKRGFTFAGNFDADHIVLVAEAPSQMFSDALCPEWGADFSIDDLIALCHSFPEEKYLQRDDPQNDSLQARLVVEDLVGESTAEHLRCMDFHTLDSLFWKRAKRLTSLQEPATGLTKAGHSSSSSSSGLGGSSGWSNDKIAAAILPVPKATSID